MDGEAEDGDVIVVAPTGEERQAALRRVAQHAVLPLLFGAVTGALWQVLVMPNLGPRSFPIRFMGPFGGPSVLTFGPQIIGASTHGRVVGIRGRLGGRGGAAQLVWTIPGPQALLCGGYVLGVLWMSITSLGPWVQNRRSVWPCGT